MTGVRQRVREVPAEATFGLRQRVLRPHQRPSELALAGDADAVTVHFAVLDEQEDVVSTVRLQPATCPWSPERPDAWQLRGMATAEHVRGLGYGAALVQRATQHVAEHGGGLLWCNARESAEGFYLRAGFAATDQRWQEPRIGPHVGMVLEVSG